MLETEGDGNSTQYWCHPRHMQSAGNSWQQIFGGLHLNSRAPNLVSMRVWIVNYVEGVDGLALLTDDRAFQDVYFRQLAANTSTPGVLFITPLPLNPPGGEYFGNAPFTNSTPSFVSNDVWTRMLQMPAYKLLPSVLSCSDWVGTTKTFGIQVTNRLGRMSNVVYHKMVVSTAGFIFTDQASVLTTNELTAEIVMASNTGEAYEPRSSGLNVSYSGDFSSSASASAAS